MTQKSIISGCIAGAAAVLLAMTGAGAASALPVPPAAPTPTSGPAAGGTEVTLELPAGPKWEQVEMGRNHGLGLATDGLLYAWDGEGENPSTEPRRIPTPAGVTFTEISVGTYINIAIASDGTVYTWNSAPARVDPDPSNVPAAVELPGGVAAQQVSAGRNFQIALGTNGRVYGWGVNSEGVLGNGSTAGAAAPVEAHLPADVSIQAISAGGEHVLAIDTDGVVWGWGNDSTGALALGETGIRNQKTPIMTGLLSSGEFARTIDASLGDGSGSSLVIDRGAEGFGSGRNDLGELGIGTNAEAREFTPFSGNEVPASGFTEVGSANDSSAAIGTDGQLYVWGNTPAALASVGGTTWSPRAAAMPEGVSSLSGLNVGMNAITAMGDDGEVYLWGTNAGTWDVQQAVALQTPEVTITSVDFGGSAAANIEQIDATHWAATTPAHNSGTFDVTVNWAIGGAPQTPIVTTNGFSFIGAPVVLALADASAPVGGTATFSLSYSGFPAPAIEWEVAFPADNSPLLRSADDWQPISADPDATVSADGSELSVVATAAHNGAKYRATATNSEGSVTTNAAVLSVTSGGGNGGDGDGGNGGNGNGGSGNGNGGSGNGSGSGSTAANQAGSLAHTGGNSLALLAFAGGAAALVGAAALIARRITRRA